MVKGGPLERGGEKRKYYRLEMVEMCRVCFLNLSLPSASLATLIGIFISIKHHQLLEKKKEEKRK
jgi:hypothetical protein